MSEDATTITLHVGHGGYKNGIMHRIKMGLQFVKFGIKIILGFQLTLYIHDVIPHKEQTK